MRIAMLLCGVESEWYDRPEEAARQSMEQVMAWVAKWNEAGKLCPGGAELTSVTTAKTIRPGPDGPVVTDGPYLELKEVVGGLILLEAQDLAEAVAIAATWPNLGGSSSIEVRAVIEH
jgi:hypothetical protein